MIDESFDAPNSAWKSLWLKNNGGQGSYAIEEGKLKVSLSGANGLFTVYNDTPLSGHFYAQVEFSEDQYSGLAIIQAKNGEPDVNNFTSIQVNQTDDGATMVRVSDRQNGIDNVLDNSGQMNRERYAHLLDFAYSVPVNKTNKKFRIFRDDLSGAFHFYYAVREFIRGQWMEGWIELAPSFDWSDQGQSFYVALLVSSGNAAKAVAEYDNLFVMQKPTQDQSDTTTGFRAVWRDYNWTGFWGDALVITFGQEFPWQSSDYKFVFWEAANWIPVWHFNNQLQFCYEFVETWGGGIEGCHEPMSDRVGRWSHVELIEDNEVRKVVKWHYVLCNPDYQVPANSIGIDLPEVDEFYTIYRDGTILRHIRYFAKLDALFRNWHELTELIVIAGTQSQAGDHLPSPALSVLNLDSERQDYFPNRDFDKSINDWPQVISVAHFKSAPDAFNVFSQDPAIPETFSYYPITYDLSWHNTTYKFAHWPVGLEPYQQPCKTHGTWDSQVTHTSLISAGVHEGIEWNDHYRTDARGRAYRQWTSLIGLAPVGSENQIRERSASWLYPADLDVTSPGARFSGYDHDKGHYLIEMENETASCDFELTVPGARGAEKGVAPIIVNPCLFLKNWPQKHVQVEIAGQPLQKDAEFFADTVEGGTLVWIRKRFAASVSVHISAENGSGVFRNATMAPDHYMLANYPNPFNGSTRIQLSCPEAARPTVTILDATGRIVKKWARLESHNGALEIHWDAESDRLPSGVYIIHMQAGNVQLTHKALLLK